VKTRWADLSGTTTRCDRGHSRESLIVIHLLQRNSTGYDYQLVLIRMGGNTMRSVDGEGVRRYAATHRKPEGVTGIKRRPVRGGFSLATFCILAVSLANLGADSGSAGNSNRGRKILEDRQCLACHSVAKEGAATAADLGRRSVTSQHSPAGLAALLWSHGPSMWDQMRSRSMQISPMSKADADDLFAYFWSLRYFDPRGEAIRGKRLFSDKQCDACHSLTSEAVAGGGPPVADWAGLSDPELLAQQLWNHSNAMEQAMVERGMEWPEFSEQEMVDLLVYLQNLSSARDDRRQLDFSSPGAGRSMFRTEACASCHTTTVTSDRVRHQPVEAAMVVGGPFSKKSNKDSRGHFNTITGFTAALWNHAPKSRIQAAAMGVRIESFSSDELGALISDIYFSGGFEEEGNPIRGQRVFQKKGCQNCHGGAAAGENALEADGRFSAAHMASAVWSHGPEMLEEMQKSDLEWPALSGRDMADLIAFLNDER
jgi:mono/diheme cytochrome c family protein